MKEKKYTKEELTITWRPEICIHAKHCWKDLGSVFQPSERPWIDVNGATSEEIISQIKKCPSGALSYELSTDLPTEAGQTKTTNTMDTQKIKIIPNGPVMIESTCQITLANGEVVTKENRVTLCRCGLSANKPFCDGGHKGEFKVD